MDDRGVRQHVSRRTVARGAAWTVPLMAVCVAAPSLAVSGNPFTVVYTPTGTAGQFSVQLSWTGLEPSTQVTFAVTYSGSGGVEGFVVTVDGTGSGSTTDGVLCTQPVFGGTIIQVMASGTPAGAVQQGFNLPLPPC